MILITVNSVSDISGPKQYVIYSVSLAKIVLLPSKLLLISTNASCHSSNVQHNRPGQRSNCFAVEDNKWQLYADRSEDIFLYCLLFNIQHNPHTVLIYELLENLYRATTSKHNLVLESAESTPAQVAAGCWGDVLITSGKK